MSKGYFKWREALWLPKWQVHAFPTSSQYQGIINLCHKLVVVREFLNHPIVVHCWLRPMAYNEAVGGAPASYHMAGRAIDFHVKGFETAEECQRIRWCLIPKLEQFGIRMEHIDGSWIHIDDGQVVNKRYFTP